MKVKLYKRYGSPRVQTFVKREWKKADAEHYKRKRVRWNPVDLTLVAYRDRRIVGTIQFFLVAGVACLDTLVVAKNQRRQGIGRELMTNLEVTAKEKGAHKIYLETGKNWRAVKFYKALGYKATAKLPNHFFHGNYLQFTKYIN